MTLANKSFLTNTGLLIIRLGLGVSFFFIHGLSKIQGGTEVWARLGKAMSNLGIEFLPVFWGFLAAFSESVAALFFAFGLFFRTSSFLLMFTMFVAMMVHLTNLDPWGRVSHSMELMFVFLGMYLIGPGKYSLDNLLFSKKRMHSEG